MAFETTGTCKHPKDCVSCSDEGTQHCAWCADQGRLEAVKADRARLMDALERAVRSDSPKDAYEVCFEALDKNADKYGVTDFHRVGTLKAACEKAWARMKLWDSDSYSDSTHCFDDEIAACEAALKMCE